MPAESAQHTDDAGSPPETPPVPPTAPEATAAPVSPPLPRWWWTPPAAEPPGSAPPVVPAPTALFGDRLFGDRWPGPSAPPSRSVLGGAAMAGVTAAAAIPPGRPGLGWLVTWLVIVAAAPAVGWRVPRPRRAVLVDLTWLLAAVGLAAVSTVRDAEWLVALCLLAAWGAGSLAVAGWSFRSVAVGGIAVAVAALRGLPWVGRGLVGTRKGSGRRSLRIAMAGLVGLGMVAVFGSLLASADAAFASVVSDLLPTVDDASVPRWVVLFPLGSGSVVGACYLLVAPPAPPGPAPVRPSRLRGLEWALPVGLLVALFALFVGVQFAALFGSDDYVLRTTGLTYAECAQSGFWQLLAVTVLTLGVIVLASRWAPAGTASERVWKRALLGALACLTLVIVASALSRMWLYQQAYGFTVLRLLVLTCELWLGVGFLLVLGSVLQLRPGGPARGMVATGLLALLALAVLDPERFVAEHNVARYAATGEIDTYYLGTLSADVVPALTRLPEPIRSCALAPIAQRLGSADDDWRSANVARAAAVATLADLQPTCRS